MTSLVSRTIIGTPHCSHPCEQLPFGGIPHALYGDRTRDRLSRSAWGNHSIVLMGCQHHQKHAICQHSLLQLLQDQRPAIHLPPTRLSPRSRHIMTIRPFQSCACALLHGHAQRCGDAPLLAGSANSSELLTSRFALGLLLTSSTPLRTGLPWREGWMNRARRWTEDEGKGIAVQHPYSRHSRV